MEASWDRNWKDEVNIAKVEAKLGERTHYRRKRAEEDAKMRQRRGQVRLEIEVSGSRRLNFENGGGGGRACGL